MANGGSGRFATWVAYDSPLSKTVLGVWYVFALSVLTLVALAPYIVFEFFVGWQPAAGALWLGALACGSLGPTLAGLLGSTALLVERREYPGSPMRRFWREIRAAPAGLKKFWCCVPLVVLLLGYDVALYGDVAVVPWAVGGIAVLLFLLLVTATLAPGGDASASLRATLSGALLRMVRRWHVSLAWLLLLVGAVLLVRVPVVGPSFLLFVPAAWACAVSVVDRARRAPLMSRSQA